MNTRLKTAMQRAGMDARQLGSVVGVDAKTVERWVAGRVPHRRNRVAAANGLEEEEAHLWPAARPDQAAGAPATAEVIGAWARRADIPQELWLALLSCARDQVDVLGYAYPFLFELPPQIWQDVKARLADGMKVRLAFADPANEHVAERDHLEQLDGMLPGRIRAAIAQARGLFDHPNVTIGLHTVHLYNAVFRFDEQMVVTPYLYRARGYQQPALHLRRLSRYGIFESYAEQYEQVWGTVRPWTSSEHAAGPQ